MAKKRENISIFIPFDIQDAIQEKVDNKETPSISRYFRDLAEVDLFGSKEDKILDKFNSK